MADETGIISGSFRGVPFSMESGTVDGGRKLSVKQFPGRDTQSVQDLGLRPRKYSLDIIVSAKQSQDYFSYRNSLIAAFEDKAPAELIHPLYGRIDSVVVDTFSLNETFGSFGDTTITVNFEVKSNTGIPQSSGNVITQVSQANDAVISGVMADISENYKVDNRFAGNFGAAVDKIQSVVDAINDSAASIIGDPANIDEFANTITSFDSTQLASSPDDLANEFAGLFSALNLLYDSSDETLEAFSNLFGFGSDDDIINTTTVGLSQRKQNNDVLNGSVSALALSYSYQSASLIQYQTTTDIDSVANRLDDQYLAVQESGSSQEVKDSITDMRLNVLGLFDEARVDASQIVTVTALPTTGRLLAFSYYGNDDLGEAIIDLNRINDVSFVEGDVEILTA